MTDTAFCNVVNLQGRDGGLPLKDNFEVGATWAFEVGSQSMLCPIIVEDLSAPRQMLVEVHCFSPYNIELGVRVVVINQFQYCPDTLRRTWIFSGNSGHTSRHGIDYLEGSHGIS